MGGGYGLTSLERALAQLTNSTPEHRSTTLHYICFCLRQEYPLHQKKKLICFYFADKKLICFLLIDGNLYGA